MTWFVAKLYSAAAAFLALVAGLLAVRYHSTRSARKDAHIEDLENAEAIRRRADTADQRMRDFDDAGWRD
jgi:hypothetical protein